jgi:thiamine-monophosphate kinase
MTLNEIGEFGFIRKISRGCIFRKDGVVRAIGDDAAVVAVQPDRLSLVTTDLLVERIHFLRDATSGFNLGYKSLAVNLSDIAAMGGIAREAFVSIAIPDTCTLNYLEDLYDGMKHLAAKFDVNILGGDTTRSKRDLVINVVVTGSATKNEILYRNTAQPGDMIASTGFLGDSRAGLHLILNDIGKDTKQVRALRNAHLLPKPYLAEGRFLAQQAGVHAAIDVSDGLSSDLGHIAEESRLGAQLFAEKIPLSSHLRHFCTEFDFDPIDFALAGGEDYTLLCTLAANQADQIAAAYERRFAQPLFLMGRMTQDRQIEIIRRDGSIAPVTSSGWDHFKK